MTKQEEEEVFSVNELAARWHRHPETIYRWIRSGLLKTSGVGFRRRVVTLATVQKIEQSDFARMQRKAKQQKARDV